MRIWRFLTLALALFLSSGISGCDWVDGDRAARDMMSDKARESCADVQAASLSMGSGNHLAAREPLITVQGRGPQTIPVDKAVELFNKLLKHPADEAALRTKIERQLSAASDLLCDQA